MTCELVDQDELDRRYLEDRLSEAEATAFEAHYFGCDRCWALVKDGASVRAARPERTAAGTRPPAWWKPLAIAAGLGIIAFGAWRLGSRGPAGQDVIRGNGDSLAVRSELTAGTWRAAWPADSAVASYRVRLFNADGRLLFSRQVTDTSIALPADSIAAIGQGASLYLDVEGFDTLQRPMARSPLIPLSAPVESP